MSRHVSQRPPALIAALGLALLAGPWAPVSPAEASPPAGARAARCHQPGPHQLPQGGRPVRLEPADFSVRIDNPYWPMRPGTVWHYVERGDGETTRVTTTVTRRTVLIEGIRARVVHDVARVGGEKVEDTLDWYAQDAGGSIWYLGEASTSFEDGQPVSTAGSWTHGTDGAQAGVVMPARPRTGCRYREEYLEGEAEDRARVLATDEPLATRVGHFDSVVHTSNTTPLEPDLLENKFYARGVGPVLEIELSPEHGVAELLRVTHR